MASKAGDGVVGLDARVKPLVPLGLTSGSQNLEGRGPLSSVLRSNLNF